MKYFRALRQRKDLSLPLAFFALVFIFYVVTEEVQPILLMATYFIGYLDCKLRQFMLSAGPRSKDEAKGGV